MEQKYVMRLKGKMDKQGDVIWSTEADTLTEAKQYFVKLKDLDEKEFDKIFEVTSANRK
jgi:hypothetical protein|tara:strand:+ start:191 stop:367 length:177 start_codon:yes stop_codon:yes gene_type:complete